MSTPYAAPIDSTFMSAAWTGTITVRKASTSSRKLSAITTRIWSGSLLEMFEAKSTEAAVVPPT